MSKYVIEFEDPPLLDLRIKGYADNIYEKTVDLFKAYEVVQNSDKEPSIPAMWEYIKKYISAETACPLEHVTQGAAWEFRKSVIKYTEEVIKTISKKLDPMLSSPQSIQDSPAVS